MARTKWLRIGVHDPADILRWAGEQDTRRLDDFRYRLIHGREFVSFRMVPRYAIQIGTCDIVVVAHVHPSAPRRLMAALGALARRAARTVSAFASRPAPTPVRTAELYQFGAAPQRSSRSLR